MARGGLGCGGQASWLGGVGARSGLGVEGHWAVLLAGVVEQGYLIDPAVDELVPVLAQPALRVPLAGEDRLLLARSAPHRAVGLLVPPSPGHRAAASSLTAASCCRVKRG